MSVEQAKAFVEGLLPLTEKFKTSAEASAESFEEELEDAAQETIDAGHAFAIEMTGHANTLTLEVQTLYNEIYPEGIPDVGEPDEEEFIEDQE